MQKQGMISSPSLLFDSFLRSVQADKKLLLNFSDLNSELARDPKITDNCN